MDKLSKPLFLGALLEKVALFQHSLSLFFLFDQKNKKTPPNIYWQKKMYGRYRSPTINSAFWLFFLMPKSFEKALGIHRGEIN